MVTQRRYSVTGQTPPDDAEAMKARSPKLQPLDTSVQTTPCGYCDGAPELSTSSEDSAASQRRGRNMSQKGTIVRTSSKRSATQLPSPSSPTHQLPPKIPRYRLNVDIDIGSDTDTDSDDADLLGDGSEHSDCHGFESQATSFPSTPEHSQQYGVSTLPDATRLEGLQLYAEERPDDDEHMDDYALSPSHSRNHSLDRIQLDGSNDVQKDWAAHIALHQEKAEIIHMEDIQATSVHDIDTLPTNDMTMTSAPPTFVTLPPEIRHQIYRNCENLVIDKPLVYCISTFDGQMQHALASVSRLVRSEALAIFYSYNLWVIKVEFKMMYEAFQDWIIRLGDGAGLLRLVSFSVRGSLFKPRRNHTQSVLIHGHLVQLAPGVIGPATTREELYCPPDGDASFKIDLSEKFAGGRVQLVRNDGTREAGEQARAHLGKMVEVLWAKRKAGTLNGQDWINMVDGFITFIGGW
ncbi:hypothetical protein CC77DRAFT_1022689 [Alternaria alternata]|jgi:hypothetical protein|uniref:F-box domain-containing protein n=3 Tax=Alternaria sect. Alternaria TaxID=2499237 RepID=A0A177DE92_ALTAL|nr:hypothetical protein CC77DRAFT_1022689 [Alternaria alternata]XP_028506555.1 hypothetical protein AA0111_g6035 [Alternaria arborescens]XP_051589936.1 uncharacterized protein J4E82_004025 [Alternaria postmessia]RII16349.1 hypothetical protein CUC08_Gglean002787 [Alternaria sp. MG1]RYN23629.1 hypothetical protein AA0115_g8557 [Alternaria tenuissima]KAH6862338.1 hypothetical protein B0T12DRAFT_453424 [Alternaria alternata]KAI5377233.1 hypothetical protein J4E82_004025 [Alternaria postmessia]O